MYGPVSINRRKAHFQYYFVRQYVRPPDMLVSSLSAYRSLLGALFFRLAIYDVSINNFFAHPSVCAFLC